MSRPELSLVIPIHNQEASLQQLDERLQQLLPTLPTDTELLFVDDASSDGSLDHLRRLANREPRYRVITLSRTFGYEHALACGMEKSRGRAILVLEPEVTDLTEVVTEMIAKWRDGYDVVHGRRRPRFGESTFNVQAQKLSDWIFAAITPIDVPRGTGNVRLVNRRVVTTMRGLHETHRFVRGLVAWVGFKQTAVDYDASGSTSNPQTSLLKRLSAAVDRITAFSTMPLRLASTLASIACLLSFVCAFVVLVTHDSSTTPGWTTLVVLASLGSAVTFFILAVLGSYVGRIYEQVKRRPLYVVSERINFRPRREQKLSTSDFAEVTAPIAAPALSATRPVPTAPPTPMMPPTPPTPMMPPTPAPPFASSTQRISALPRPLPATPPPSFAAPVVRPKTASSAGLTGSFPVTPSSPPPKVTPSVPPPSKAAPSVPPPSKVAQSVPPPAKATPSMSPAMTPNAPNAPVVKTASIAPTPVTTRSAPPKLGSSAPTPLAPTSKAPSIAPPAPTPSIPLVKGGSVPPPSVVTTGTVKVGAVPFKATQRSAPATIPPPSGNVVVSDPKKLFAPATNPDAQRDSAKSTARGGAVPSVRPAAVEESDDDHTLIESRESVESRKPKD